MDSHHHHNHHNHHQPPQSMLLHHHHHHHNHPYTTPQMIATPNNRFPFSPPPQPPPQIGVISSPSSTTATPPSHPPQGSNDPKKKRGRPRKYSPDGGDGGGGGGSGGGGGRNGIDLGLSPPPMPLPLPPASGGSGGGGGGDEGGAAENVLKRHRGRPPSSSKKQLDALGNCGVGFTPHVILVNAGEDIAQKIIAFSKQGPRTVCVLSANGSVCNVSLRQPANSGGIINYEGRFEIISISGSYLFSENSGEEVRTGGLSVSLAGSDGRVLGGGVAGVLMAASPVQIIVGSFIANGKKTKYMPSVPQSYASSFAVPTQPTAESPPSQEGSSEGSEENGSNHIDRNIGSYGNSNHPVHNMHMYNPIGWPGSAAKMLQN